MPYIKDLKKGLGINSNDLLHVWNTDSNSDEMYSIDDLQGVFGSDVEEMSQSEYNRLTPAERLDGKVRYIIDGGVEVVYGQVTALPLPSVDELGKVYQYIGTSDQNYTHGYFYECVNNNNTYSWQNLKVQNSSDLSIAYIESSSIASRSYEKDDMLFYNGVLYKVILDNGISAGSSIIFSGVSANVLETNVSSELKNKQNDLGLLIKNGKLCVRHMVEE